MTALNEYLVKLIKAQGPIPLSTFMAEALGNEKHGYYMKQDPFGAQGDFITAPEISQMFGEMIGLWFANNWLNMNSPDKIHLGELGPGRGTLMQDILRTMGSIPTLSAAIVPHLVEMSPVLQDIQAKNLKDYTTPLWHSRIGALLEAAGGEPLFIIANEFFDALPLRQYQKTDNGWHERLVCLNDNEELCLQLAPMPSPEHIIPAALHRADAGQIAEVCTISENICSEISEYIQHYGGACLFIDYGHVRHATGDTLQAVRNHKYVNILSDIGDADLTTHVNFQRLKEIGLNAEVKVYGPTGQGKFLKSLGIETRAQSLSVKASPTQAKDILSALHRLTDEAEMGDLFKVMALADNGLTGIIGFED